VSHPAQYRNVIARLDPPARPEPLDVKARA